MYKQNCILHVKPLYSPRYILLSVGLKNVSILMVTDVTQSFWCTHSNHSRIWDINYLSLTLIKTGHAVLPPNPSLHSTLKVKVDLDNFDVATSNIYQRVVRYLRTRDGDDFVHKFLCFCVRNGLLCTKCQSTKGTHRHRILKVKLDLDFNDQVFMAN